MKTSGGRAGGLAGCGLWACGRSVWALLHSGLRGGAKNRHPSSRQNAPSPQPTFQVDAKATTGCETADRASRGGVDREWTPPFRELGSNTVQYSYTTK